MIDFMGTDDDTPRPSGLRAYLAPAPLATVIASVIAGAVALIVAFGPPRAAATPSQQGVAPPSALVENSLQIKWLGGDGRYAASGTVVNSVPGQLIWIYNEPMTPNVGSLYPEYGPCPIGPGGVFNCSLNYAGSSAMDPNRSFSIWVALVSPEQAYEAMRVKSKLDSDDNSFKSPQQTPHLPGICTFVRVLVTHPSPSQLPEDPPPGGTCVS